MPPGRGELRRRKPMRRRTVLIGGAAVALTAVDRLARAAPRDGQFRIGVLLSSLAPTEEFMAALVEGLAQLGYVEGVNTTLLIRSAEGDMTRLPALAREL